MTNTNLPAGAEAQLEETEMKECPTCDGSGHDPENVSNCCGDPIEFTDICSNKECQEHCDPAPCWTCDGKKEITRQQFDALKAEEAAEYDENN